MSNKYGHGLAVNIAENTAAPGGGRIIASAFSTTGPDFGYTDVLYTTGLMISRATLRRFPDLVNATYHTFGCDARLHPRYIEVARDTVSRIEDNNEAGGYLIAWDAPALLERLLKYDLRVPERILDLKVLHRLLFPKYRGRRDLNTLAELLDLDITPGAGLVEEVEIAVSCGLAIMEMVEEGAISDRALDGSSWESLMRDQRTAASKQWSTLCDWIQSQGRDPATLRNGWPVWGEL